MTLLLAIVAAGVGSLIFLVRALAIDEAKGRIRRHVTAQLETTIASLPEELQSEWGEEWRAELSVVISMPWTAHRFVRGVRTNAYQLTGECELVPATSTSALSVTRITRATDAALSARKWAQRNQRASMKLVGLANVALSLLDFVLSVLIGRVNAGFLALELTTLLIGILLVSLARRQ